MFSIVLTTFREFDAIEPLFKVSDSETEIIIIDTNHNEQTKKHIKEVKHDYYQVTYAPPRGKSIYCRDFCQSINTGFAYAENEWIIKLDDLTEMKPDFFNVLRKTMGSATSRFGNDFIIELVKIDECDDSSYKKWAHPYIDGISSRQDFDVFVLNREGLGGRGMFSSLANFVMHASTLDRLNGMDERYDFGCGYDDTDLFQRAITAGYTIIMNKNLMTFKYRHKKNQSPLDLTRTLFKVELEEIRNGKYKAYNRQTLAELRKQLLPLKAKYLV